MSATGANTPANHFGGSFGPNEWLVQEMYERYQQDPQSVDKSWWDFFADFKGVPTSAFAPANGSSNGINNVSSAGINNGTSSQRGVPPIPKQVLKQSAQAQSASAQINSAQVAPVQSESVQSAPVPSAAVQSVATQATTQSAPTQSAPAQSTPTQSTKSQPVPVAPAGTNVQPLRGVAARVVQSMEASLSVPTATSVRAIPAKLMIDNRTVINNHLKRGRGGKVSFTHLIGYAMIKAARAMPEMNAFYTEQDGKPALGQPEHINLGIAIDLAKPDGSRQLLVPSIKNCESLDFAQFWSAYEDMVRKARGGSLTVEDFAGTTMSLTNPGTIGTVHSVPRLVQGQGLILGVGAMDYPAEFHGASVETISELGISKVVTLTSTYDHRIIQGAQSGDFLRRIHEILLGGEDFYDEIFQALRIPYVPIRWVPDVSVKKNVEIDSEIDKTARVQKLIDAYRTTGHLMADIDPLEYAQRSHPDLDIVNHGLTLWDLDREFATGGFGGKPVMKLRKILGILRDSYCRTIGVEYM